MDKKNVADNGQMFAALMCRCCGRLCRLMNNVLSRTGVNMPQCQAMTVLKETGETSMSVLARELGVTMGAATNLVDRLVEAGHVNRSRIEADRRVVNVGLTPKGSETLERDTTSLGEFWSKVLDRVRPEERTTFFRIYEEILKVAEGMSPRKKK